MTLVVGINTGFCAISPTADPVGDLTLSMETKSIAIKAISPSNAGKITEIGFWAPGGFGSTDVQLGLYASDGSGGSAGTRLQVSIQSSHNAGGWTKVVVDWTISSNTTYWLAIQIDSGSGTPRLDRGFGSGDYNILDSGETQLNDPFGSGSTNDNLHHSIFAVYEETSTGTTRKIKISGSFVDKPILTKVAGTFVDKPIKIKVGGTFQDT